MCVQIAEFLSKPETIFIHSRDTAIIIHILQNVKAKKVITVEEWLCKTNRLSVKINANYFIVKKYLTLYF
jgi:hypothetical protein